MATEVGAIKARLELDTSRYKAGMDRAKQQTKELGSEANKAKMSIGGLESALVALGASSALVGMVRTIKSLVDEANQLSNSLKGLSEVSRALGQDIGKTNALAQKFVDDGLMGMADAANAVKIGLTMGLGLEETEKLMTALADAAAYNRASHLSMSEAVAQGMQAIKMGNSELLDNTGIVTNLSVFQNRYAQSLGTTADKLTESGKVAAAYNGILAESSMFAGNAKTAMEGYNGTQATWNQTMQVARQELGEAFMPVLKDVLEAITPVIKQFADWTSNNKETVAGLGAAAVAATAFIAVVGALATAFLVLNAAMGGVGLILTAVAAVAVGIGAYTAAANSASKAANDFANSQGILNAKLAQSPASITAEDYRTMQTNMETLNGVLQTRIDLETEYNALMAKANGGPVALEDTVRLLEIEEALGGINKQLRDMNYSSVEEASAAYTKMETASRQALGAQVQMVGESMRETIAHADNVKQLKALSDEYDTLTRNEKLTEEQKARLAQVVQSLKKEYPDLLVQLDEENQWHIENKNSLDEYIDGEGQRVDAAASASIKVLTIAKTEAEERVNILRKNMADLEKAANSGFEFDGPLGDALPDHVKETLGMGFRDSANQAASGIRNEINQTQYNINEAVKKIQAVSTGNFDEFRTSSGSTPHTTGGKDSGSGGGKGGTKPGKTVEQIQNEAFRSSMRFIDHKRAMNEMSESEEVRSLERLLGRYKHNADIRMELEERIKSVKDQMVDDEERRTEEQTRKTEEAAHDRFQASEVWIDKEIRKMEERGASEKEIAAFQLEAWTRVKNRYAANSDFYIEADKAVHDAKMDIVEIEEKASAEAEDDLKRREKAALDATLDAIDKAKDAELKALDDRRRATERFYDDQIESIDDAERSTEREKLQAEADLYRNATSAAGQERYAELTEQLRKMDAEDRKRALGDERDDKLAALDDQKRDIETHYGELREMLTSFTGDMATLYQVMEDGRLKAFVETNAKIKAEMATFLTDIGVPTLPITGGVGSRPVPGALAGLTGAGIAEIGRSMAGFLPGMARSTPINVNIERVMDIKDVHLEDGIDIRTLGREAGNTAAAVVNSQISRGGKAK